MVIIFLMLILIIIFAIWLAFNMVDFIVLGLINLLIVAPILLRAIADFRDKKNITIYLISLAISFSIIYLFNANNIIMALRRIMILEVVQLLLLVFFIAQIIMYFQKRN